MMQAAVDALASGTNRPLLTAVTVLTSMDSSDLLELGISESPMEKVASLTALAQSSGVDGVVCSAAEAAVLKERCREGFLLVTPGIRLPGDDAGDQRRVVSPKDAMLAGATHLVMGRSITGAAHPAAAVEHTLQSLIANS